MHTRQRERSEVRARLEAGASLLMLAPRRIGKTWLMNEVKSDLAKANWNCFFVDLEGLQTEREFLVALCREIERSRDLKQRIGTRLKQALNQIMSADDAGLVVNAQQLDPRTYLEALIESLDGEERPTVILIDEISLFMLERASKDADGAKTLLYLLRKLQQRFKGVRWFLTGSVGLDAVARRFGIEGALVDFEIFPLEPFDRDAARSFAELPENQPAASPFTFEDGAFDFMVDEIGWLSPYYLRLVTSKIRPSQQQPGGSGRSQCRQQDVEAAMNELLQPAYRSMFSTYREHIRKNFEPAQSDRLQLLLGKLSETARGETSATLLAAAHASSPTLTLSELRADLRALVSDGFILSTDERWTFRSGLLRRYWLEYEV